MELTYAEKQLILYSKGHFKKSDLLEDLKIIAAKQYGLPVEHTGYNSIYGFVVRTFLKLKYNNYIKITDEDFFLKLFGYINNKIDFIEMMEKMLAEITWAKVRGMNLGDPDGSLLPLKKHVNGIAL